MPPAWPGPWPAPGCWPRCTRGRRRDRRAGARLHKGADALFEEERVAVGPLGQQPLERLQRRISAEQGGEQLVGALRRERVDPKLGVVGLAPPTVAVLGPVVHEQQERAAGQALHEGVEERLGLRVDPVQVLEHEKKRLDLALAQQQAFDRRRGSVAGAATDRVSAHGLPSGGTSRSGERGGRTMSGLSVKRQQCPGHLRADSSSVVAVVDLAVGFSRSRTGR